MNNPDIAAIERLFGAEYTGVLRDTLVDIVRIGTRPGSAGLTLQLAFHLPGAAPALAQEIPVNKLLERYEDQIMLAALGVAADVARRTAESPEEAAREVVRAARAAAEGLRVIPEPASSIPRESR